MRNYALLAMAFVGILLFPGFATIRTAWEKIGAPSVPAPIPLTATGLGALGVNLSCAFILESYRDHSGSLTRAAFLSARNGVTSAPRRR